MTLSPMSLSCGQICLIGITVGKALSNHGHYNNYNKTSVREVRLTSSFLMYILIYNISFQEILSFNYKYQVTRTS